MEILVTSYSPTMIALSFVVSVVGSFIALSAAPRVVRADGSINYVNTFTAGTALGGIGVWAMHFFGMLALRLPIGHGYSMIETGISLVAAIAAAAGALVYVARKPDSLLRLMTAGLFLGLGVCFMHYVGMYGMRFGGYFSWSMPLVMASVVIAFVAATAALWLAFNTTGRKGSVGAALVMGVAVCAMHYTGMSAADFVCTSASKAAMPVGFAVLSSWQLPTLVFAAVAWMIVQLGLDQFFATLRHHAQPIYPQMSDVAPEAIVWPTAWPARRGSNPRPTA